MSVDLPREAAVMVLPNAVLMPNALLPLHIFEEQYREMLRWSLERDRLFSIAMRREGAPEDEAANFHPVGGLGLVRACVGAEDGTSNLILQGLARVRYGTLVREEPFRVAEIEAFPSECPNPVEAEALGIKVIELCDQLREQGRQLPPALVDKLRHVADPALLADIVTQAFVREPLLQQEVLEQRCVSERMRILIRYLRGEVAV